jgi:hypothetical protein
MKSFCEYELEVKRMYETVVGYEALVEELLRFGHGLANGLVHLPLQIMCMI